MPIYAYRCESCGHTKDVLQKLSDSPLTECPSCGASAFKKQLTAPGFQLKGSGWYATDFKSPAPATAKSTEAAPACASSTDGTAATCAGPCAAAAGATAGSGTTH